MNVPLRVLIIEDSEVDTLLLIRELKRSGFEPDYLRVESPAELQTALDENTWDIVFVDYSMPHLGGLEALEILRTRELDIPYILISGAVSEDQAVQAVKAGAHDFITKDNLKRLKTVVERELRETETRRRHREAERKLQRSERRYRELYEGSRDGYVMIDLSGLIVEFNAAFRAMLGYREEELRGKPFSDITPASWRKKEKTLMENQVMTRGYSDLYERDFIRSNRTKFPAELQFYLQKSEKGYPVGFWSFVRDIGERQKMEADLSHSEERYAAMIEGAPTAIVLLDKKGVVQSVNRTGLIATGFDSKEILGLHFSRLPFLPERESPGLEKLFQAILKGKTLPPVIFTWHNKSGTEHFGELQTSLVKEKGKISGVQLVINDITERVRAETALKESEERFRVLVSSMEDVVYTLDTEQKHTGVFGQWSEKEGMKAEDFLGKSARDLFGEKAAAVHEKAGKSALKGRYTVYEWSAESPAGTRYFQTSLSPIRGEKGRVTGLVGIGRDITKLKQALEAQRESEERYRLLFTETVAGYALHEMISDEKGTPVDYRFIDVNSAFERLTGLQREEIIGKTAKQTIPFLESFWIEKYGEVALTGKSIRFEQYSRALDKYFEVSAFSPKPGQVAVAFNDVTDRRNAEHNLERSIREKEILLREIHHRVKNNLQIISSLLSLQADLLTDPVAIDGLHECQNRIRSMSLIHERLYQSPDLTRIDFSEYIQSLAVQTFQFYKVDSRRIRLEEKLQKLPLELHTAIPCGIIVQELLSNAVKYAFPGKKKGTVHVELQKHKDDSYSLRVSDNGIGFPVGIDFRKMKSLGMRILVQLVEQIDGAIELKRDGGTDFHIRFREVKYKPRLSL